ncbi:conserved hypothetical protein [Ricinus communis]|uniref:Uncharacterized protein n=1 Tax=Ricinus communis TaxID=3988 RepID=B9TPJ8_RICCO|nr:conserved hypothetical protein [Ricinus communis]
MQKAQGLDRQHREDARHQVEDQPADERESHRCPQAQVVHTRGGGGRRRCRRAAGHRRVHRPGPAVHQQQAFDRLARLGRLLTDRHAQVPVIACASQRRLGGMLDAAPIVRQEQRLPDIHRTGGLSRPAQRHLTTVDARAHRIGHGDGQRGARTGQGVGLRRVHGPGRHRQHEGQGRLLGNARLAADQPGHLGRQRRASSWGQVLWQPDLGEQERPILVAVVRDRSDIEALRRGPEDVAGLRACG